MKRLALATIVLFASMTAHGATYTTGRPHSTNNDDSCDIALLPAATLLLPWFEVDLKKPAGAGETTLLTITNVSNFEQVARVTLWTDRAYPVITFNVYLTGYDVQSLNLYDILVLGQIAPPRGTGYEDAGSPEGDFSDDNPLVQRFSCRNLPMSLPQAYIVRMQQAFTEGTIPQLGGLPACNGIGGRHPRAVGYATIDVVSACGTSSPADAAYFTKDILFDNVLIGEYHQIDGGQNYAQGAPMVHIRAMPEGGTAQQRAEAPQQYKSNLPRTFYGQYQSTAAPAFDARQPLPSQFSAHWISGGPGAFKTELKIWREGRAATRCDVAPLNADIPVAEIVRFDEEENFTVLPEPICCIIPWDTKLAAASRVNIENRDVIPPVDSVDALGGWLFLNLDDPQRPGPDQAWIVSSMRAEGRFSVDADVVALGNGCTPARSGQSNANDPGGAPIGPAAEANP